MVSHHDDIAFSQAVPLVDVDTGNTTLNNALPGFYECIDDSIKTNGRSNLDSYFEEPTKNEVTACYYKIFNNASQGNNDDIGGNDDE